MILRSLPSKPFDWPPLHDYESVPMQVVRVRHVSMGVPGWLMAMPVAMFSRWHGVVCVPVMVVVDNATCSR